MSKELKITIETDSLLILRGQKSQRTWCSKCGSEVEMIPLDSTGVISNLAPPEVEAWIQSEDLHHIQTSDGAPLVCLNSMLKLVRKSTTAKA
jgi:hypothetical protein